MAERTDFINGYTLQKPLNATEERMYLQKKAEGDKEAEDILVERNLRLVMYVAKKYANTGVEIEELFSIGTFGLMKAVRTYSLEKKTKLATYAAKCIENEIFMFLRRVKKHQNNISIHDILSVDNDGRELRIEDILIDPKSDFTTKYTQDEELLELVSYILNELNTQQKLVILYGMSNMTQIDIGGALNLSQSYVSRIRKKAREKLTNKHFYNNDDPLYKVTKDGYNYVVYVPKSAVKNAEEFCHMMETQMNRLLKEKSNTIREIGNEYLITLPYEDYNSYYVLAMVVSYIEG